MLQGKLLQPCNNYFFNKNCYNFCRRTLGLCDIIISISLNRQKEIKLKKIENKPMRFSTILQQTHACQFKLKNRLKKNLRRFY